MVEQLIRQFRGLFVGYQHAHGQHRLHVQAEASGKIKGDAKTVVGEAGNEEYRVHLFGEGTSLGLIPLLEDNTCWFGAIDLDIQGVVKLTETIEQVEERIRALELPLVVCRSKSGGAHLYLFAEQPIAAPVMVKKLAEFSRVLGYGGCEVFPKQVTRVDASDRGNWINIAMYGALADAGTERYCLRNGKQIRDLAKFISYANAMRVTEKDLGSIKAKRTSQVGELFADGPPCLEIMAGEGIGEGGRNTTLTNITIYYKKKYENDWQDKVADFNRDHIHPPLPHAEVAQIITNMGRKDPYYTCKQPPICNFCDKKECVKREFGVASGHDVAETFELDNLTRCVSKDTVGWYAEHEGCRVRLTTEQLMNPMELQKIFVEKFMKVIIPGKRHEWLERLTVMMETCSEVIEPDDASTQGQFENLIDNFFSASRPARNKDELIKGNSYTEGGLIYFRSEDLFNYLNVRRFQHKPQDIWFWLKTMGAKAHSMRIKGKSIRVWSLPEPERFDGSDISMPTQLVGEL